MRNVKHTGVLITILVAAACGGSPTAPSATQGGSGATIAGTVSLAGSSKAINAMNGAPAAGVTVRVTGTNLAATVNASGYFQIGGVPGGRVELQFRDSSIDASAELSNVTSTQLVEIQVQVSGTTATIVSDARFDAKVSLCHRAEGHGYHMITISPDAEPAHRAHGDAKVGEPVPGETTQTFDANCQPVGPSISLVTSTNGDDANEPTGPEINVGDPVAWQYLVANTGTVALSGIAVTDDRGVAVSCPSTSLAVGQSMTCTASGTATLGQYANVGSVTATGNAITVTDSDPSHYLGIAPQVDEDDGPKVELCHRTGNGSYHLISVGASAEPAHRAHGDAKIGEAVPGNPGKVFGAGCTVR